MPFYVQVKCFCTSHLHLSFPELWAFRHFLDNFRLRTQLITVFTDILHHVGNAGSAPMRKQNVTIVWQCRSSFNFSGIQELALQVSSTHLCRLERNIQDILWIYGYRWRGNILDTFMPVHSRCITAVILVPFLCCGQVSPILGFCAKFACVLKSSPERLFPCLEFVEEWLHYYVPTFLNSSQMVHRYCKNKIHTANIGHMDTKASFIDFWKWLHCVVVLEAAEACVSCRKNWAPSDFIQVSLICENKLLYR